MSASQPPQPFRFLDLPPEVRQSIYDEALCSWDIEPSPKPYFPTKLSKQCLSYQGAALLRVNKEINAEASDYMLKRNQFVRVTCCGFDIERLFWSQGVPVVSTDPRKLSQYNDYVMHIELSRPFGSPKLQSPNFEMMILQSDLMFFCEKLDVESARVYRFSNFNVCSSLRMEIQFKDSLAQYYTPKVQQRLLKPLSTHLRGIHDFTILGPVDPILKQTVIDQVVLPRWTNADSLLQEIDNDYQVGELHWAQNEYSEAAESWARALCTLERIRWSSSWLSLNESGGEGFSKKTADLYYSLNLLYAEFLQVEMDNNSVCASVTQRNARLSMTHLVKCGNASILFAPAATPIWIPNARQTTTMLFLRARWARLMHDLDNMFKANHLIHIATSRDPSNVKIAQESRAVEDWVRKNEQAWYAWHIRRAEEACKTMAESAMRMVQETERLIEVMSDYAERNSSQTT